MNAQLIKKAALDRYISQGYTPAQAALLWNSFLTKQANNIVEEFKEKTEKAKKKIEETEAETINKLKTMRPKAGIKGLIYRLGERIGHKAKELQ